MDEGARRRDARWSIAAEVLAGGGSYSEAGAVAGVTGRTIARWMKQEHFAALVAERREEAVTMVLGGLSSLVPEALDTLRRVMRDPKTADAGRAASFVLTHFARVRQAEEVEVRLREVETRLGIRPDATREDDTTSGDDEGEH
jgi:hypothetical protein